MRRSDRLGEMIRILRDGRIHRAEDMARRLGVTARTVYRDMDTLAASGVPVEGARGLGYAMTAPISLPPLNLSMVELEALHLGISVVGQADDPELRTAARSLSAKIDAVLPEDRSTAPTGWGFATYPFQDAAAGFAHLPPLRAAIRARQKLRLHYADPAGTSFDSVIRPLKLDYWGRIWTCISWCEASQDFRTLRIDRMQSLSLLPALFVEEQGKTLVDFAARSNPEARR